MVVESNKSCKINCYVNILESFTYIHTYIYSICVQLFAKFLHQNKAEIVMA